MAAAAAALSKCSFLPTITCMKPNPKRKPINPLLFPNSYQPISFSITNPRLGISHTEAILPKRSRRLFVVSGLVDGNSETCPEVESNDLNEESATIDIKLPRRSLLVQFTCNECGERSQRLINRLAYERGLVFVQCAGCERYHKLVDNLGLVVEYDLREEISAESNADQV
ncbi:mitochondrial protein import protein ZIM17 isoform X1 [Populus alba]|uniref:Zinc finger family protein n=2 Tax=Populus TaxID=3689 RepID=A0A4U5QWZ1_POPAL|nr:mitochondrial protein import protein ZIM17 isoform X1 [Populus alba]KAG6759693.1 hypothetical protein POTOM_036178 [Populus tomentosa]TKS15069.1 zinc finger family protein [Populus alba]